MPNAFRDRGRVVVVDINIIEEVHAVGGGILARENGQILTNNYTRQAMVVKANEMAGVKVGSMINLLVEQTNEEFPQETATPTATPPEEDGA